eukprot:4515625-Alexandrium_andersonii.AAC.1
MAVILANAPDTLRDHLCLGMMEEPSYAQMRSQLERYYLSQKQWGGDGHHQHDAGGAAPMEIGA